MKSDSTIISINREARLGLHHFLMFFFLYLFFTFKNSNLQCQWMKKNNSFFKEREEKHHSIMNENWELKWSLPYIQQRPREVNFKCISEALKENGGEMLYDVPTCIFPLHMDSLLIISHLSSSRYTNNVNYSTAKTSYISIFHHFNIH